MSESQSVFPGADYKVRVRRLPTGETIQAVYLDIGTGDSENPITDGGLPTSSAALALRLDSASATITYIGEAAPGSLEADSVWRIKKVDESSGTVIQWADGESTFDKIWNDRASITYS